MRRVLAIFFTVLSVLTILFNISVCATSKTYDLRELELQVTIPSGYSVITRDTPANDPIFKKLGTTKSALISQFENNSVYLDAVSDTYNEEVVVTMMKNSISNFSTLSDTVLNTLASTAVNQISGSGFNVFKYDIYQHSQAKFIRLYFSDTSDTVHGLQYYTVYDGKAMNFTIRSYEGRISSRQEMVIKSIVDSVKYDKTPIPVQQGEDTDSFIYTDIDSGATFTVPANWKQTEFTEEREFIDTKFVSTKDGACTMIYGSTDIWEQMPESDKVGYTRSDLNNSAFTKSDISEMYGTTSNKIDTVTYNGVQYFKLEGNYTSNTYGVNITITMTQMIYIDNGWMYTFQFSGTNTHKLYSDFENLIKSVQYSTNFDGGSVDTNESATSESSNINYSTNNNDEESSDVSAVIALLSIAAGIVILVVVLYRKKNSHAKDVPVCALQPPKKIELHIFCKNCGQVLPIDSDFCHMCGTKVFKGDNDL